MKTNSIKEITWADFMKEEAESSKEKSLMPSPLVKSTKWKLTLFAEKTELVEIDYIENKKKGCNIL